MTPQRIIAPQPLSKLSSTRPSHLFNATTLALPLCSSNPWCLADAVITNINCRETSRGLPHSVLHTNRSPAPYTPLAPPGGGGETLGQHITG